MKTFIASLCAIIIGLAIGAGMVIGVVWLSSAAHAHSWYDPFCCTGKDCQPLPDDAVLRSTPEGYEVEYRSQHGHMVKGFVSHDKVKPSQDGKPHACETAMRSVRCLYLPLGS